MKACYLVDKSALARMPLAPVRERLAPILEAGEAATCAIIDLEVLFSARNRREHEAIRRRRELAYERADFDVIAEVTGQPTEWVVARGSV